MERAILQFTIDKETDPDRSELRSVLEAQFAYERMSTARSWFAHLLAVLGFVLWLETIWPDLLSSDIRFYTLPVFGGVLFLTIRAAMAEFASHRRLKCCLAAKRGFALRDPGELF